MFGHVHHHLSKEVDKEIAIAISLCILACGLGLAYAMYETQTQLNNADWASTTSDITYTYSIQARGGRSSASFTPSYLISASYTYTSTDGVTHQGHDYTTITGYVPSDNVAHGTTVNGTVYYDQKDPNVSHVFPLGTGSDLLAWFGVGMIVFLGAVILIESLTGF